MKNKILLGYLLAPPSPRGFAKSIYSVLQQQYDEQLDILFIKDDNPEEDHKYENIKNKHNRLRKKVLKENYTHLFLVEYDNILPLDALQKLLSCNSDVAYGLYCNRHGFMQWLAYESLENGGGKSLSLDIEKRNKAWNNIVETKGAGFGCTLIKRNVLKKIEFRNHPDHKVADDWMFALDCQENGFKQVHNCSVHVGHMLNDCSIIWPTITNKKGYYIQLPDDYIKEENKPIEIGMQTKVLYKTSE